MTKPTRITFYLGKDGMPAWLIQSIYHQVSQFSSQVSLIQIQSQRQVDVKQYLNIMSMAFKPYELCQLHIHQPDTPELEHKLCAFLAKYTQVIYPIVSSFHKLEVDAVMQQLSTDFDWSFIHPSAKLHEFRQMMKKADPYASLDEQNYAVKEFLLQQIINVAPTNDSTRLYTQLKNRESVSSTAMKSGVALPHTISEAVKKPAIIVTALDKDVDWGGPFGGVSRIITLLLPSQPTHLQMGAFRALSLSFLNQNTGRFICEHQSKQELTALLHCLMKMPKQILSQAS